MNAFIPAFVAVLLAEIGARSGALARSDRTLLLAGCAGLLIGGAAVAGLLVAPIMSPHARLLMLGLALILSAAGQFGRARAPAAAPGALRSLLLLWGASATLLAFALAAWLAAPVSAAAGALAGLASAVIGGAALSAGVSSAHLALIRRIAGGTLLLVGGFCMLQGLRLV